MSSNVFSEFTTPQLPNNTNSQNKNNQEKINNKETVTQKAETSENIYKVYPEATLVLSRKQKFIKTAKTTAPIVVPLAAIPLSVLISYKISSKGSKQITKELSKLSTEITGLKNEFGNIKTSVTDAGQKIAQQSETVSKLNNKVVKLSALLAGGILTYNAGKSTGKNEEERMSYYNNLISNTKLNYDSETPPQSIQTSKKNYKKMFPYKDCSRDLTEKSEEAFVKNLSDKFVRNEDINIPLKKVSVDENQKKKFSIENLEESLRQLGENIPIGMNIAYGKRTNWSNNKIARDIMQNFYDANNHTLDGVGFSVKQSENGYKVRISGNAFYDCKSLLELGSGNKLEESPYNAGGFGEGSRIVVASLLGQGKSDKVTFASSDWKLSFNQENNSIMRTLNKTSENIEGNYIEFETKDKDLVEAMIESLNYFEHSNNADFEKLDYNSKDFAFKILDNEEKGNLYLTQRFEYGKDECWANGVEGINLIFKRKPDPQKYKEVTGEEFSTGGRDRLLYNKDDIYNLTKYFSMDMSDEELIDAILKTKQHWGSITDSTSKENYAITAFINGLCDAASKRNLAIDFGEMKICKDFEYMDAAVKKSIINKGYTIVPAFLKLDNVGMDNLVEVKRKTSSHTPIKPNENEIKKIKLLDEAVRVIQESVQTSFKRKLKIIYPKIKDKINTSAGYIKNDVMSALKEMDDADFAKGYNTIFLDDKKLEQFTKELVEYLDEKIANISLLSLKEINAIANILNSYIGNENGEIYRQIKTQLSYLELISAEDISKPKYIFDRKNEVSSNTLGEAIIDSNPGGSRTYNGHWVDKTYLDTADFYELLATWLHEISHKSGGDGTSEFTYKLTDLIEALINAGVCSNNMKDELAAIEKVFNSIK